MAHKRLTPAEFHVSTRGISRQFGEVVELMNFNANVESNHPEFKPLIEEGTTFSKLVSVLFILLASTKKTKLHPTLVKYLATFIVQAS